MKIRIANVSSKNFELIPKPADKRYNCQQCFYWIGKQDGRLNLSEQKRKWLERKAEKHGALAKVLFADEESVGYVQFGPIAEFATVNFFYKGISLPRGGWCITCLSIRPSWRKKGLGFKLLKSVLTDLKRRGIKTVDAYPVKDTKCLNEISTGPIGLYQKASFEAVKDIEGSYPSTLVRKFLGKK